MPTALDYSAGRPTGAAVRQAGHVGVVRYAGTPGRTKNITKAEFDDMNRTGIGVALVFEDAAGDALKGRSRGVTAAQAIAADAAAIGFPSSRPLYFAVDQDITTQMGTVLEYFRGIGSVLGGRPVGVYGEADVLDAVIGAGLASYGWQTTGWSRGRAAKVRHLFQTTQQPYVGGIQVDINNILATDWGQHNAHQEEEVQLDDDVVLWDGKSTAKVKNCLASVIGHGANMDTKITALTGTVNQLTQMVGKLNGVTPDQLAAALAPALLPDLLAAVKDDLADVEHLDENAVADRLAANLAGRLAQ